MLGTESDNALIWLWAWAEEQTEVPDRLLAASRELKAWGENERIPELTLPSLDLNRTDGTMLSLIASEVCKASGFYRVPAAGDATPEKVMMIDKLAVAPIKAKSADALVFTVQRFEEFPDLWATQTGALGFRKG